MIFFSQKNKFQRKWANNGSSYETGTVNGVVFYSRKFSLKTHLFTKWDNFRIRNGNGNGMLYPIYVRPICIVPETWCMQMCMRAYVCKCESLEIISSQEHHQLHWFHISAILFQWIYMPFWQMYSEQMVTPSNILHFSFGFSSYFFHLHIHSFIHYFSFLFLSFTLSVRYFFFMHAFNAYFSPNILPHMFGHKDY